MAIAPQLPLALRGVIPRAVVTLIVLFVSTICGTYELGSASLLFLAWIGRSVGHVDGLLRVSTPTVGLLNVLRLLSRHERRSRTQVVQKTTVHRELCDLDAFVFEAYIR